MTDYVDGVLKKFMKRYDGQYLDHSHAYGPQSPDLIAYYLTELLGRPWQFRAGAAAALWDDPHGDMADFERVERGPQKQASVDFQPGDVLVFKGGQGFGTVGIYVRPGSRVGSVQMFTQNPGPAKIIDIMADGVLNQLLGGWRLTYGAECKIVADKFAQQLDLAPTCPPGDLTPYRDYLKPRDLQREINDADLRAGDKRVIETTTPADPTGSHWLKAKAVDDPTLRPGDIVTFGLDGIKHGRPLDYGHVEIVTAKQARHYRRQTLIERLKALFGR